MQQINQKLNSIIKGDNAEDPSQGEANVLSIIIKKELILTEDLRNVLLTSGLTLPDTITQVSVSFLLTEPFVQKVVPSYPVSYGTKSKKPIRIDHRCALNELLQNSTLSMLSYTYEPIIGGTGSIDSWHCMLFACEAGEPIVMDGYGKRKVDAQEDAAQKVWRDLKINTGTRLHQLIQSQLNGTHGEATNEDDLAERLCRILQHIAVVIDESINLQPFSLDLMLNPLIDLNQTKQLIAQEYISFLTSTSGQQLVINMMRLDEYYELYINSRIGQILGVYEIVLSSGDYSVCFMVGMDRIQPSLLAFNKTYMDTTFSNLLNFVTHQPFLIQVTHLTANKQVSLNSFRMLKKDLNFSTLFGSRLFTTYHQIFYQQYQVEENLLVKLVSTYRTHRYDCKKKKYDRKILVHKSKFLSMYEVHDRIHDSNFLVCIEDNPGPTYTQIVILLSILFLLRKFISELCSTSYAYIHRPISNRQARSTSQRTINFDNGYDACGNAGVNGVVFDTITRPASTTCNCQFDRSLYVNNLSHPNIFKMRTIFTTTVYSDVFTAPNNTTSYYEYSAGTQFTKQIPDYYLYSNFKHYVKSDDYFDYFYFCQHDVSHIGTWSSTERLVSGNKYMQNAGYGSNTSSNTSSKLTTVEITYTRRFLFKQENDSEIFTAVINPHTFVSDWKQANYMDVSPATVSKTMKAKLNTMLKNVCTDYQNHMTDDYDNLLDRLIEPRPLKPYEFFLIKYGLVTPWKVIRVTFTEPTIQCKGKHSTPLPLMAINGLNANLPTSDLRNINNPIFSTNLTSLNLSSPSPIPNINSNLIFNTSLITLGARMQGASDDEVELRQFFGTNNVNVLPYNPINTSLQPVEIKKEVKELKRPLSNDLKNKTLSAQNKIDQCADQKEAYLNWLDKIDIEKKKLRPCSYRNEFVEKTFPLLVPHHRKFEELHSPVCHTHCFNFSLYALGIDIGYNNQFFRDSVDLEYVQWTCEYYDVNLFVFIETTKVLTQLYSSSKHSDSIVAYQSDNRMHILYGYAKKGYTGLSLFRVCPRNYAHVPPEINPMSFYKIRHNHNRTELLYFKKDLKCSPYRVNGPIFLRSPPLYSEQEITEFMVSQEINIERCYFTCVNCEKMCGVQIGPICPDVMPLVYSNCMGSFFNGLENRWLAGQAIVFKPNDWQRPMLFYKQLLLYFEQLIYEGFDMDYAFWFLDAYLNQTTLKKKQIDSFMLDLRRNISRFSRKCKTFIKKEIAVPRDVEKDKSVRLIGNPEDGAQLMALGRCFDKLLNAVSIAQQTLQYFQFQTTRGLNAPEAGQKFLWLITDPGHECFKTIINGDDSLSMYFNGKGFNVCLEIDGGRFESTFNSVKIDCELEMARKVFSMMTDRPTDERVKHIEYSLEFMKQFNLRFSFNASLTATQLESFYNYMVPLSMKRTTGQVFTSGGNCFQNLGMLNEFSFHMLNSDVNNYMEHIDLATLSLINTGLIPEVKVHRNPWNGSFCSGYFYPAMFNNEEVPVYGPNYKRMAVKLGFNISSATVDIKRMRKTLYLGLRRDFNHLPILRGLIDSYKNDSKPYRTTVRFKYMGIHVDAKFEQSPNIYQRLEELYGLNPAEVDFMDGDDFSGNTSMFHLYFNSYDNSRYLKIKEFGRSDQIENNSLHSIEDIFNPFMSSQTKTTTIVTKPKKNRNSRNNKSKKAAKSAYSKEVKAINDLATTMKRNTGMGARPKVHKDQQSLERVSAASVRLSNAAYLTSLTKYCVGAIINPDAYEPVAWPVRQTQPVYPLKTKYSIPVTASNFAPDAAAITNGYNYTGSQCCLTIMSANGPNQSIGITAGYLAQVNQRPLSGQISQIVGTGLNAGVVGVLVNGAYCQPLITAGEMELPAATLTNWPWDLQIAQGSDFVIPVGDVSLPQGQIYPISTTLTTAPVITVPSGGLATVGSPRLAFAASGSYPPGMIATVTLSNSTSTNQVAWNIPVGSSRTWVGPSTLSGASLTYDQITLQFFSESGGPMAMQGELSFFGADVPTVAMPNTPYHLQWKVDATAQTLPNFIADSMCVTAASMLITNTSALQALNGKIYLNRFYPWVGYGTPSGVTLQNRMVNYNSAYLDLPAATGAYSYLPGQSLPFDMIGINNRLATRGVIVAAIYADVVAEGGESFEIVRCTHYNVGTASQLLATSIPVPVQSCLEHVTAAIERAQIGTENPKHVEFAAKVLKNIHNLASSDAITSLCKMIGVALPRAANAVDLSRDFVAKSTGAASSALGAWANM